MTDTTDLVALRATNKELQTEIDKLRKTFGKHGAQVVEAIQAEQRAKAVTKELRSKIVVLNTAYRAVRTENEALRKLHDEAQVTNEN